jgi:hypothetical protein
MLLPEVKDIAERSGLIPETSACPCWRWTASLVEQLATAFGDAAEAEPDDEREGVHGQRDRSQSRKWVLARWASSGAVSTLPLTWANRPAV